MFKLLGALCLVAAVCIGLAIYLNQFGASEHSEAAGKKAEGFLATENEFQDKLEELRRKRDMLQLRLTRLQQRKDEAAQRLKQLGITKAGDLDANAEAKFVYREIRGIMDDMEKLSRDEVIYSEAIIAIEAELRKRDRDRVMENAGISEEQFQQLRTIFHDVNERLTRQESVSETLETQRVLDDLLGKPSPDSKDNDP